MGFLSDGGPSCVAVASRRRSETRVGRPLVLRWPTFSGVFATKQFLVQTFRTVPELPIGPAVAKRARQLKPGLGEGLVLAGAVSLALFAWGLREIRQAL
jgi:hypothetical protein